MPSAVVYETTFNSGVPLTPFVTLAADARRALAQILPPARLLLDLGERLAYGYDNSRRTALPDAVALAESQAEVQAIVGACHTHGVPLVARGRGTNTTGAAVPIGAAIALCLEDLFRLVLSLEGTLSGEHGVGLEAQVCRLGSSRAEPGADA